MDQVQFIEEFISKEIVILHEAKECNYINMDDLTTSSPMIRLV